MKTLDKIKQITTSNDSENAITSGSDTPTRLKTAIQQERQAQSYMKLKDLVMSKDKAKIEYCDPESKKPVFIDRGTIVTAKTDDRAAIAIMLEYANEKFGGSLKLNGTDEFKKQCAEVAAEKGMNIILHPDKYHQLMQDHKAELAASIEASNESPHQEQPMPEQQSASSIELEHGNNPLGASSSSFDELRDVPAYLRNTEDSGLTINDAVKASTQNSTKDTVEQSEQTKIYLVSHSGDENIGVLFHSKDAAMNCFEKANADAIMRMETREAAEFENIIVIAKSISVNELDAYKEGTIGEFNKPYEVIADSQKEFDSPLYVVSFEKEELSENIKSFESIIEAIEYKDQVSMQHGLNPDDAIIGKIPRGVLTVESIQNAAKDAVPVPLHELASIKDQAKSHSQQLTDDKGMNTREQLLDEYQQAHSDRGLSFERDFERGEISHLHDDAAREYLQEALQGRIERANGQEKQESEL